MLCANELIMDKDIQKIYRYAIALQNKYANIDGKDSAKEIIRWLIDACEQYSSKRSLNEILNALILLKSIEE